jgi:hypothetical protein
MKFAIVIGALLIPSAGLASPTYLKCQLDKDIGKASPWEVTLHEEAGRVTYSFPDLGLRFTVQGTFTADKVMFQSFTVDRTNFAFQRDLSHVQAPGRAPIIDKGRCYLAQAKRAF